MNRYRVIRFLRIGWSAVCGILCLLLIALWVRSYWRYDMVTYIHSVKTMICAYSGGGRCMIVISPQSWASLESNLHSHDITTQSFVSLPNSLLGFYFHQVPSEATVTFVFPYWFVSLLTGVIAATVVSPWLHWRFQPPHSANRDDGGSGCHWPDCGV